MATATHEKTFADMTLGEVKDRFDQAFREMTEAVLAANAYADEHERPTEIALDKREAAIEEISELRHSALLAFDELDELLSDLRAKLADFKLAYCLGPDGKLSALGWTLVGMQR